MTSDEILFQRVDEKLSHIFIWNNGRHIKSITLHGRNACQSLETEAQVAIWDEILSTE